MSGKALALEYINEAVESGARKKLACNVLGISLRTVQRWKKNLRDDGRRGNRFSVSNSLSKKEVKKIIRMVCSERFRDLSPNQIVPIMAENGVYLASESTMYRILRREGLLAHRTRAKAPERKKPEEFVATGPNQVWTWDISYLRTYTQGVFVYLYLMMDIWDRSIVGWAIHEKECGSFAADLLRESCINHGVDLESLIIHQDNGAAMISSEFTNELGIWGRPSYSRPGICDDNPYSEALFRTTKYRPGYPLAFKSIEEAREWMNDFVQWYHFEHRHSGINFVTPMQKRQGKDAAIMTKRTSTYESARREHPERWSRNVRKWEVVKEVTLNPKKNKKDRQEKAA